jgi:hypothetical protein
MDRPKSFASVLGPCALAVALLFAPRAAQAQDVPSYARPTDASVDETIHGRIRSVDGAFTISVDDDRGFVDEVQLHGGTIINPTGLALAPGMSVTIIGYNAGATFDANEIDTPYSYDGPLPAPIYYGPGYWCPGFAYGYGPSFGLAIVFGFGGGWHYEHRGFYGRPWNGNAYFGHAVSFVPGGRDHLDAQRGEALRSGEARRSYGVSGRGAVAGEHAPAAFSGRMFAGEGRFSSESNAPAPRARFSGGEQAAARAAGREPNDGAGREPNYTAGRQPNYAAGRESIFRGGRSAEPARGGAAHAEGGRGEGGHGGGHSR